MHEMSIVEALLGTVRQTVAADDLPAVRAVRVRVGRLRQVMPEMLQFCFGAAVRETPLQSARLEVESVAGRARCGSCRQEFAVDEQWFECPQCGAPDAALLAGDELLLVGIQLAVADKLSPASV